VRKNIDGLSLARAQKKARLTSGMRGRGAVVVGGGARPFIGARGAGEAITGGIMTSVNGLHH
jgi:hypothetical protein